MLVRYLIPLAPFVLIAVICILLLFYFVYVQHDIRAMKRRIENSHLAHQSAAADFNAKLSDLSARVFEAEERTGVLVPPAPPKSGFNLNKRSQALRMSRRGDQADKIAAALSLPRREVELLLKIQRSIVYDSTDANS